MIPHGLQYTLKALCDTVLTIPAAFTASVDFVLSVSEILNYLTYFPLQVILFDDLVILLVPVMIST